MINQKSFEQALFFNALFFQEGGELWMDNSCIYKITNNQNNMVYVGQTIVGFKRRIATHKWELKSNRHKNEHLQRAWSLYGEDNFKFSIIELCNKENIDGREMFWIKELNTMDEKFGYNLESGGNKNKYASNETKLKVSKGVRLAQMKPEYKTKMKIYRDNHSGSNNPSSKSVICLNDGLIYGALSEASIYYEVPITQVSRVVSGDRISIYCKKLKKYLQFSFYEKDKQYSLKDNKNIKEPVKVICVTTKEIFESTHKAAIHYNLSQGSLVRCCKGEGRYYGKDANGNPLLWEYLSNYDENKKYKILKYEGDRNHKSRAVICITTGEYFECQSQAEKKYNICTGKISMTCAGKRKHAGKLENGIRLAWEYALI